MTTKTQSTAVNQRTRLPFPANWALQLGLPELLTSWYLYVYLTTIALSFAAALNRTSVVVAQAAFVVVALAIVMHGGMHLPRPDRYSSAIASLAAVLFVQGFSSAPNTTDSMVYHLPRVMHWIQARSVFQSQILNDHDFLGPFGEYVTLQLYLLTDSDRLAYLSQWLAYIGIVVTAVRVADRLAIARSSHGIVALLVGTVPMALMQASSTQVDLLTASLFLSSILFALHLRDKSSLCSVFLFSSALGLGILTKATILIFEIVPATIAAPVLPRMVRQKPAYILVALLMLLVTLTPFVAQNEALYQSPLGEHRTPAGVLIYTNETLSPQAVISNTVRNIVTQLPMPLFAGKLQSALVAFHRLLGIDINDPRTTWYGEQFHVESILIPQEDSVANPLQVILIAGTGLALAIGRPRCPPRLIVWLYVLTIVVFLLFSAAFKWQPWHSRLLLPLLTVGMIISASVLDSKPRVLAGAAALSTVLAVPLILFNVSRPLISYRPFAALVRPYMVTEIVLPESIFSKPRFDQYFNARPYWEAPYIEISQLVAADHDQAVGLDLMDGFEYPFWVALRSQSPDLMVFPVQHGNSGAIVYTASVPRAYGRQACIASDRAEAYACFVRVRAGE